MTKVVLLLSGWSDGPLDVLRYYDPAFADVRFVMVPLPTPPVGVRWCLNAWCVAVLVVAAAGVLALSSPGLGLGWVGRAAVLCAVAVALRLVVARLVRRNVADSIGAAERAIARLGGQVDAVVGFSWGGGVLWRWLAESRGVGPRAPCLLLAPTIGAIAAVAARPPATTLAQVDAERVHVLVGTEDPFMGSVEHALSGVTVHKVADDHVLCSGQARGLAAGILQTFLMTTSSTSSTASASTHH